MIIDTHTHTFPQTIARRAISHLETLSGCQAIGSGLEGDLLQSMEQAGIDLSIIAPIATSPRAHSINLKSAGQKNPKLLFLGAIHPQTENREEEICFLKEAGFKGIKMHPDFQDFRVDDEKVFPIYEAMEQNGLFLLLHAGEDVSFRGSRKGSPEKIARILTIFPRLKIIAAHMGGYDSWEEALTHLTGYDNLWLDTAFCAGTLSPDRFETLIKEFHFQKILLGSDWPWMEQRKSVEAIQSLSLSDVEKTAILGENMQKLLNGEENSSKRAAAPEYEPQE